MDQEDYADDFDKYCQNTEYLTGIGHIEEYSEDIERQQWYDGSLYGLHYDIFKVMSSIF